VPHPVNAQPGFLQQVVSVGAALRLRHEKSVQLGTKGFDQRGGGGEVTLLIASHQRFEIAVGGHAMDSLLSVDLSVFAQSLPRCQKTAAILFRHVIG
jgi:hypothetical protein